MYNVHAPYLFHQKIGQKNAFYLSVNVFGTNWRLYFSGDGNTILRDHPSHAKVQPFVGQRKTISNGPAQGIEPSTSHSVTSSTDWISLTKRFDRRALHSVHYNSITYLTHDHSRFVLVHQDDNNTSSSILWEKTWVSLQLLCSQKKDEVINRF